CGGAPRGARAHRGVPRARRAGPRRPLAGASRRRGGAGRAPRRDPGLREHQARQREALPRSRGRARGPPRLKLPALREGRDGQRKRRFGLRRALFLPAGHASRAHRLHVRHHSQRPTHPRTGGNMSKTEPTWPDEVEKRLDAMITLRRDFHRHPELSFQERRTSEIIAERLHAAGLEVRTGRAKTGGVGVLRGDRPGRTVAWRADIDALPLTETLDAPFTSGTPGVMHACGHDGHTAIAITLADILAARRREIPGTAVFLFQPAEEILGGARPMIEAGALQARPVDHVHGLHLTPTPPAGLGAARARAAPACA